MVSAIVCSSARFAASLQNVLQPPGTDKVVVWLKTITVTSRGKAEGWKLAVGLSEGCPDGWPDGSAEGCCEGWFVG